MPLHRSFAVALALFAAASCLSIARSDDPTPLDRSGATRLVRDENPGPVCIKWNADKYAQLTDGCVVFRRDDDRTVSTGMRTGALTGALTRTALDAS